MSFKMGSKENNSTLHSLRKKFAKEILSETEFRGDFGFYIISEKLFEVLKFCKEELKFEYLTDITSIDFPNDELRFEVVYHIYSLKDKTTLKICVKISEGEELQSIESLWASANWHEREIYDMMGIIFSDHTNLKRILMWEGYPYHPLRKDFPLEGIKSSSEDIAFSEVAPLSGGPFVSNEGTTRLEKEPRPKN